MPHAITQCYLPSGRADIPAFTPRSSKAGTRLSDPGWMLQVKNSSIRLAVLIQYRLVTDRHMSFANTVSPLGAARRYAPRRWQFDPKIAADLRPSADGSAHLRWRAVAKPQAASVPIA